MSAAPILARAGLRLRGPVAVPALFLAALFLAALPAACHPAESTMHIVKADLGGTIVTLALPDGLVATPRPAGLAIRRVDADDRRDIYEMMLTPARGASPVALDRVRGAGGEAIRYGLTRGEGGSGGEEATLIAERRCGAATLRLRLDMQAGEDGTVDPEPALAILASARCPAAE